MTHIKFRKLWQINKPQILQVTEEQSFDHSCGKVRKDCINWQENADQCSKPNYPVNKNAIQNWKMSAHYVNNTTTYVDNE